MNKRHILITGASGGLGGALCRIYAEPGTHLTLWGRNEAGLMQLAETCQAQGAQTTLVVRDIRDLDACREHLRLIQTDHPVDMAILNAGVSSGTLPNGDPEPVEDACRTLHCNATANINMAATLLEDMRARGHGHLVLVSSLAALYPFADSPAYCAAKAALAVYAKAARDWPGNRGVRVSTVYPGYVDSPMSRRLKGAQPMRWSAEKAATHIRTQLEAGANSIMFPRLLALGSLALHLLPTPLARCIYRGLRFTIDPDSDSPARHKG
ncbi:SDR family NAD(P)-dependent oxidoreductase [Desulfovibrio sp. OttesenSCG-928-M14]|nr:SDR family NAD(P)-dependent oxidoreductase [Desulfovibrio sp. OttesenSCG-928-M14]